MKADELTRHLDAAKEAALGYEAALATTVKRLLVRQGNSAAAAFLRKVQPAGDAGWSVPHQDEIFDLKAEEQRAEEKIGRRREQALKAYTRELPQTIATPDRAIAAAGRRRATPPGHIRLSWDVTSPFIAPVFEKTGEQIASITYTTRGKVMDVIQKAYTDGLSIPDTAAEIRAVVRGSSEGRAATIARTEMVRLVNGAQLAATKVVSDVAEIGYYKRWLTAPGAEHPRHEDYEGLDGQTVALDALFDVGGEELDFPGDPGGSPDETCNCRCAMEMIEAQPSAGLPSDLMDEELTAAASGSTSLPLSDRNTPWDAGAARKTLKDSDFADAHFWKDPNGKSDQIGSYKLPFAKRSGGSLTAVWGGVTAAAQRLSSTDIPSGDVAGVKSKIASYYRKAAKQYNDPQIKPPWEGAAVDDVEALEIADAEYREYAAGSPMEGQCANCDHAAADHAGPMNDGACSVENCSCTAMQSDDTDGGDDSEPDPGDQKDKPVPERQMALSFTPQIISTSSNGTNGTFTVVFEHVVDPSLAADATVDLPAELQPGETLPAENPSPAAPEADLGTSAAYARWNAIFAPEGKATDDGRIFAPGAIKWRSLPLSLMAMTETPGEGGHAGAELCGRIDNIFRDTESTPNLIRANGVFNDDEVGTRISQLVADGFLTGNSVDLAVSGSKVVLRGDVVDDNGYWIDGLELDEVEEINVLDIMFGEVDFADALFVITDATIGMSTVCPFPAFAEASISLASDGSQRRWAMFQGFAPGVQTVHMDEAIRLVSDDAHLTASAAGLAPVVPPAEWFMDPQLDELTPLTVTDEGRVYGHAWEWDTCHIGIQDACTVAPHSETGYAYFLLKEVETDDGQRIECGTITLDTNHAARHLSWRDAASHYDHTGTAIADVTFGEDEHGGWFSGAVRPDASAEAVRKFRGATVSGDWRRIHGNLELVGLLTVNVPGFPVPRTRALVAAAEEGSEVLTLIAAGIPDAPKPADVTEAGIAELAVLAEQARGGLDELAALAQRARE